LNERNNFIARLAAICAAAWIIAAIRPVDRQAWILENVLLVLFVGLLALRHRRLQLSNASYFFLAIFILLHIAGAHYTYAQMPLGIWARDYFGLARNHFDRVGHFAFGFLLVFPARELLLRFGRIKGGWSFCLAPAVILAASGLFEIIESITAEIVAPGKGMAWLGGQGDQWDAQNDMLSALTGSLIMMAVTALIERRKPER
jgi:putative membrane protein